MLPYYRVQNLGMYTDLNPANQLGGAVMDAGLITFSPGSYILTQFAIGFKKDETYCAAPVTSIPLNQGGHLAVYDFWVVGTNCCSGEPGQPSWPSPPAPATPTAPARPPPRTATRMA